MNENNDLIDMLAEKLGAEYVGNLISKEFKFMGVHCTCGKLKILNPTRNAKMFKCPICATYTEYVDYYKKDGDRICSDEYITLLNVKI